jgi:hypothetical protein
MRVMILAIAAGPENPPNPTAEAVEAYWKFHGELVEAGVLLAGDRLHPGAEASRVRFEGTSRTVTDGPFTEAKELVAGFWIWQVRSMDEAIEWLKRAPYDGGEFEVRQIFDQPMTS